MIDKQTFQLLRIAALLGVIFATGVVVGRYTAPTPDSAPFTVNPAPRRDLVEHTVSMMSLRFEFDEETETRFRELMEQMEQDMRPFEPGSAERRDVWRGYLPRIRAFVPKHLMNRFEAQTRRTERRFERMIEQNRQGK